MSSDKTVIRVDDVSKAFEIFDRPEDRLKQMVVPKLRSLMGRPSPAYHRKFWALQNVSLEVKSGQAVGIIGQNGSGKSTLLQIITGTMTPSSGTVLTEGRVAALLELGSGFNPEFTGRENVYMNASLLGLSRAQTDEKFDYIASFADIGEHLDQPVKTYSSGMMLRLAFAVQIAVETEILIIDEALAVGDARFQLKCFRRLDELKTNGTTILFVSHAIELVRSFCDHGLVLNHGTTLYWGDAKAATIKYLQLLFPDNEQLPDTKTEETRNSSRESTSHGEADASDACLSIENPQLTGQVYGAGGAEFLSLKFYGLGSPNLLVGGTTAMIRCHFRWDIEFVRNLVESGGYERNITVGVALANNKGNYIFGCNGFDAGLAIDCLEDGNCTVEFKLSVPFLADGDYFVTAAITVGTQKHHVQLRWYDSVTQLKSLNMDRNVYGVFAVDYEMARI